MKFDNWNCLIREKHPEGHIANLGDSCAETCRSILLGDSENLHDLSMLPFFARTGFVRHPELRDIPGWDEKDFSNDQLLPLIMVMQLRNIIDLTFNDGMNILATKTPLSIGVVALIYKQYWLLNVSNIIQGWILKLPYRIGDDFKIEKSKGQVQDYLNMICIWKFLKLKNKWATLPRPANECLAAVRKYYVEGDDIEPNSQWIVDLYEKVLV